MTVSTTKSMILFTVSAAYTASSSSLIVEVEAATHALHLLFLSTVPYSRID